MRLPFKGNLMDLGASQGVGAPYVEQAVLDDPPLARDGFIFWLRALVHVGRAIDPDWKDWERSTLNYPEPVVAPMDRIHQILETKKVIPKPSAASTLGWQSYHERVAARKREGELLTRLAADEKDYHENWKTNCVAHAPGVAALDRAFRALAKAVVNGDVTAYSQPLNGGRLEALDPSLFTLRDIKANAIRRGAWKSGERWYRLFVDEGELERAFPLHRESPIAGVPLERLSPYLRLAIHVALSQSVDEGYRGKKENQTDAILAAMDSFGLTEDDLGKVARGYLATFIRWPDAQKGRAEVPKG